MNRIVGKLYFKYRGLIFVLIIIFLLIIIPFIIDLLVYKKELLGFTMDVNSNEKEWFSFLCSYIGAVAAVILGLIALYQNHILSNANSELNQIQEKYFSLLSSPIISFTKVIHSKCDRRFCEEDSLKSVVASYVVLKDLDVSEYEIIWNHAFEFYIINDSNIPLEGFNVDYAEIKVNHRTYKFDGLDHKNKISRLIRIDNKYKLNLVFAYPRLINEKNDKFNDISSLFETGSESKETRESELFVKFKITNQLGYENKYNAKFNIYSELANQYIIKEYVISTISKYTSDKHDN
jgi:hypothetical protein